MVMKRRNWCLVKIWAREKCTRLVDSVQWNLSSVHCLVTGHNNSDGDNLIVVQFMCFWKCPNKMKPEKPSDNVRGPQNRTSHGGNAELPFSPLYQIS